MGETITGWPRRPYKGLAKYSRSDAPLFVGRDAEVDICSDRLVSVDLSLFILHGLSGSGKSSFLRAGLLPKLETGQYRYLRPTLTHDGDSPAVFRSGLAPLRSLARALWRMTESLPELAARRELNAQVAGEARLGAGSEQEFVTKAQNSGEMVYRSMEQFSLLPEKLLLVIDQAEDMFPGESEGIAEHLQFFRLLALLSDMPLDAKLLISMRSEFKARLDEQLSAARVQLAALDSYYLEPISDQGMVDAIRRPTTNEPVSWHGLELPPPRQHYKFTFDEDLPELIGRDLRRNVEPTARLPVLQVICDRLYSRLKHGVPNRLIGHADYRATGACNAQVASHIEEKIVQFFQPFEGSNISFAGQADSWKLVLADLGQRQLDGKVRARLGVPLSKLVQDAERENCRFPDRMLGWLEEPDTCILEKSSEIEPANEPSWRLVHESIAAALLHWRDVERSEGRRPFSDSDPVLDTDLPDYVLPPPTPLVEFHTVNDLIWDHMLALYAEYRGFSSRLGLRFIVKDEYNATKTKAEIDVESFLRETTPDGYRLAVQPLVLYPELRQDPWTVVGVPNVYRGYAILGPPHDGILPIGGVHDGSGHAGHIRQRSRLENLARFLARPDTRVGAFEERSLDFLKFIMKSFGHDRKDFGVAAPAGNRRTQARDRIFTELVDGDIDIGVGPAPSRALAQQAGFLVYAEFEDVRSLLGHGLDRLLMHEVLAVDVPTSEEPILLRLLAMMLYTVDHIRRDPEDFVAYLYDQILFSLNDDGYWLQRRFIRQTVESCYRYAATTDYGFRYLTASSVASFLQGTAVASHYQHWLRLRAKCDELLRVLMDVAPNRWTPPASEALERGERQYRIYNFYDAEAEFRRAAAAVSAG